MSENSTPWKSRYAHPRAGKPPRVVHELHNPITYEGEPVQHVAVSHGTYGDTGIFPCDSEGRITNFEGIWMEDHMHVPHDEAFTAWVGGEDRPGFLQSLSGVRPEVIR